MISESAKGKLFQQMAKKIHNLADKHFYWKLIRVQLVNAIIQIQMDTWNLQIFRSQLLIIIIIHLFLHARQ